MKSSRTWAPLLCFSLGIAACGVFGSAEAEPPTEPPARVDADAAAEGGALPVEAGATPDGAPAPLCLVSQEKTESFVSVADGLIAESSPQKFGSIDVCNASVGRCLARFDLSTAAANAMATKRVLEMKLTLRRADSSAQCGTGTTSCVPLRQAGTLSVVPVRVDWAEGQMGWLDADGTKKWGAPGAGLIGTDIGSIAGTATIADTDLTPTITLDPTRWQEYAFLSASSLAVRWELLENGLRRQFVTVTHEPGALPHEPPKLTISYCP